MLTLPKERRELDYDQQEQADDRKRLAENMRIIRSFENKGYKTHSYANSEPADYEYDERRANGFNGY